MKLDELTKNVKLQLENKLNITKTISIINIPKQELFEKGSLIILLNDKNKPVVTEFLKSNGVNIELKNNTIPKILIEKILINQLTLFHVDDFDNSIDNDFYIDYKSLDANIKKDMRNYIKRSENIFYESSLRFGKLDKSKLMKQLNNQTGLFNIWMQEHDYTSFNKECLLEAYMEATQFNDTQLKKRACITNCFYKISRLKGL